MDYLVIDKTLLTEEALKGINAILKKESVNSVNIYEALTDIEADAQLDYIKDCQYELIDEHGEEAVKEALKDMFNELIYDLDGQLETLDINNYLY